MIDSRVPSDGLSGEELHELLRDDETESDLAEGRPGAPAPAPAAPVTRRVLLVCRAEDEVEILRSRLEAHGAVVTVVRNPFTALDQLRRAVYDAVVSDAGLWANGGSLLFDRIRQSDPGTPVLVLGEAAGSPEGRGHGGGGQGGAIGSGAWGVLPRPLRTAQVESSVADLLASCNGRAADLPPASAPSAPEGLAGSGTPRPSPASPPEAPDRAAGELAWLRFFFHCGRNLSPDLTGEERMRRIASVALDHLRPRAAAASIRSGSRDIAFVVGEVLEDPVRGPETVLARVEGDPSEDDLVIRSGVQEAPACLVLRGLSAPLRLAAPEFLEDIRRLLSV